MTVMPRGMLLSFSLIRGTCAIRIVQVGAKQKTSLRKAPRSVALRACYNWCE